MRDKSIIIPASPGDNEINKSFLGVQGVTTCVVAACRTFQKSPLVAEGKLRRLK